MNDKPRTKIVCTLGPATEDDEVLRAMIRAGMTVARLNFSHGDHAYHRQNIERVRRISKELGTTIAIMVDTKGPEIRTGLNVGHEPFALRTGDHVVITTRKVAGTSECFCIDYATLPQEVGPGSTIYIDDGLIALRVERTEGSDIHCLVINGGSVGERKGVNVPNVHMNLPAVTEQDRQDIEFACQVDVDAVAASFIRNGAAVQEVRKICASFGKPNMMIISKIESSLAIDCLDEILDASDGIMVARGDLGVEIPAALLPHLQKEIIEQCNKRNLPVITATQMLESMTHHPRPTRAEVTDVANAIYDGSDCVMLSGETAAGSYPVESVQTMAEICVQTEPHLTEIRRYYEGEGGIEGTSSVAAHCAVQVAKYMGAKAILCPTYRGATARMVASLRPTCAIIAASPEEQTIRKTNFMWGVQGILTDRREWLSQICYMSMSRATEAGYLQHGDLVVITAGDPLTSPIRDDGDLNTNVCMISQVP